MKPSIYLFCICLIVSCYKQDNNQTHSYRDFPKEQRLQHQTIPLDTALFRYPFRIAVRDSMAIVMDLHNMDHYLHAFTYPEWKHIISFGRRGEAPEEMLSAETIRFCSPDSLWTLDANKMEITRWTIDPKNKKAVRTEEIPVDKQLVRALDFFPMDAGFLIPDYLGEHRFHHINRQGEKIASFGNIPTAKQYKQTELVPLAQGWRSFMGYHPEKKILVMATQLGEVIEIYPLSDYNSSATNRNVLKGEHGDPKVVFSQGHGIPVGIMGFNDIQVTDKHIYAVFSGRSFKDIALSSQNRETIEDGGRFIYMFDLEGNPVKRFLLDRAIYGIFVDEEKGIITATDVNNDEPIISFDFSLE